jgi:cell wall-associated NlpC family hydrolase/putative cell wall-binding protein
MGTTIGVVALGAFAGASYSGPSAAVLAQLASSGPTTARLSGPDRYATAAAVSAATFPAGAPIAYVATGGDYPDALSAAAAAGGRGPVLLGGAGGLPGSTILELERLHPARVVIVGGTVALPTSAEAAVRTVLPGASVSRMQGADRYVTAAVLMDAAFSGPVPVAYVATGQAFPDALTAAAAAAGTGPVLLVPRQGLPVATEFALTRLQPRQVFLVGGTGAVPAATQAAIAGLLPRSVVIRIAGSDRYATSAAVSAAAFPSGASTAYLATGADFPDALTAAAAAAGRGPVLLVRTGLTPPVVLTEVRRLRLFHVVLVGGSAAVSDAAVGQVVAARLSAGTPGGTTGTVPQPTPTTRATPATTPVTLRLTPTTSARAKTIRPTTTTLKTTTTPTTLTAATFAPTTLAPTLTRATPATTTTATTPTRTTTTTSTPTTTAPTPTTATVTPTTSRPTPTTLAPTAPAPAPRASAAIAVATAEAQIGKPYAWAGAGPAAFDCSGLTMYAWAAAGVTLPHNAAAQASLLPAIPADTAHLAPGDLLFYDSSIDHVAMYVGNGMMVEAAHSGVPVRLIAMRTDGLIGAGRP